MSDISIKPVIEFTEFHKEKINKDSYKKVKNLLNKTKLKELNEKTFNCQ